MILDQVLDTVSDCNNFCLLAIPKFLQFTEYQKMHLKAASILQYNLRYIYFLLYAFTFLVSVMKIAMQGLARGLG